MTDNDPQTIVQKPDLEASIQVLNSAMEDDPTSEKPLDALIQVEEALRSMLEVKELSKETKAEIDRVLMGLTGRTISTFLDEIHERAFRVMKSNAAEAKEDIEGYLAKLNIVYRKVERVILNPDERNGYITGSGKGVEKKELQTNKLQHLLELLRANEIYTDDICIVIGENTPNMMREGSYLYIEIPKVKRTILLHLGYGEASFVLYDIYDRAMVFDMTKEQIQEKLGAAKVEYTERDLNKWGTEMLKVLKLNEAVAQPKINMENYDRRLFYIEEIKKLYPTPEEFMALIQLKRLSLKINGRGLTYICTLITKTSKLDVLHQKKDLALLAREIYGETHKVIEEALKEDLDDWTKDQYIQEFRRRFPTPEECMLLNSEQKGAIEIRGRKITNLGTIIIGESGLNPFNSTRDFAVLAKKIYGDGHEIIEVELWERDKWIEVIKKRFPTPEEFMGMSYEQRIALTLYGKKLIRIASIVTGNFGINPFENIKSMALLAKAVYGEGHEVIENHLNPLDKIECIAEMKKRYPTPEEFIELEEEEKRLLIIRGRGVKKIAAIILGRTGLNPIDRSSEMFEFVQEIYGAEHPYIKKLREISCIKNWSRENWIEKIKELFPTPESFMGLDFTQRQSKINGKGLKYISTIVTGNSKLFPTGKNRDMAVFAKAIYGEGHIIIENALKEDETESWSKEKWLEVIKEKFSTPEEFMSLTQKERLELEFYGRKLYFLGAFLTGRNDLNPATIANHMAILAKEIYGEGYEIIDCEFWDINQWCEKVKEIYPNRNRFLVLSAKERRDFIILERKLTKISRIITNDPEFIPFNGKSMQILADLIYGDNDKKSDNN